MSCDNSKNSFKQMLYFWIQYDTLLIFWQCIFSGFEVGTLCKALSISQFGSAPAAVSGMVGPSVCLERREKPVTPSNPWGQQHHRQLLTILYHRLTASAPAQLCPTMFSTGTEKSFPIIWVLRRKSFSIFEEESFGGSAFIPDPVSGRVESGHF